MKDAVKSLCEDDEPKKENPAQIENKQETSENEETQIWLKKVGIWIPTFYFI